MGQRFVIQVVVTAQESEQIRQWADEDDRTVSALMRQIVQDALREKASREEAAEGE
jgi:hypothetical protein